MPSCGSAEKGFIGYGVKTYAESDIPGWERYDLDLERRKLPA